MSWNGKTERPIDNSPAAMQEVETAKRFNKGKVQYAQLLYFGPALEAMARHCEKGREKYPDSAPGAPNWLLGGKPREEYIDSMLRHVMAYHRGEVYDDETETHHLAAIMWNAAAALTLLHGHEPAVKGEQVDSDRHTRIPIEVEDCDVDGCAPLLREPEESPSHLIELETSRRQWDWHDRD